MIKEYYVGQIFINDYPSAASDFCNYSKNYYLKEIEPENGHRRFQIVENVHPAPTREEIKQQRKQYRETHIDDETAERSRCMANGTWTAEDEQSYLALDAEVTAWIEENLPYPAE